MHWIQKHPVWTVLGFLLLQAPGTIMSWWSLVERVGGDEAVPDIVVWITAVASPLSVLVLALLVKSVRGLAEDVGRARDDAKQARAEAEKAHSEIPRLQDGRPAITRGPHGLEIEDDDGTVTVL